MFLLDANVLVYALTDSAYREPCTALIEAVATGRIRGHASVAVLEEVWHLELRGALSGMNGATTAYHQIFTPLLSVTDDVFRRALAIDAQRLGSMDRIHAATCHEWGLRTIVSADSAFDELRSPRRVDPLDVRAVERLLRG